MKRKAVVWILAAILVSAVAGCAPAAAGPTSAPATVAPEESLTAAGFAKQIHWLRSTNDIAHNTIQIRTDDLVIYLDPVALVDRDQLPKADIILVTHDHADHFSIADIQALSKPETRVVVFDSPTVTRSFRNAVPLSAGKTADVLGVSVTGVPAYNEYHPLNLGYLGFVFEWAGVRVYCSGDTGLTPEMLALTDIDIAVLNYYTPYVLSPEAVLEFAKAVQPSIVIPIHWKPEAADRPEAASLAELPAEWPASVDLLILPLE